jgi:hypothetical protein
MSTLTTADFEAIDDRLRLAIDLRIDALKSEMKADNIALAAETNASMIAALTALINERFDNAQKESNTKIQQQTIKTPDIQLSPIITTEDNELILDNDKQKNLNDSWRQNFDDTFVKAGKNVLTSDNNQKLNSNNDNRQ